MEAYVKIDSSIFDRIHERWKLGLKLIIAGKGSNNLVEACRGLKANFATLPTVPEDDSDCECTIKELIKKAKDDDDQVKFEVCSANRPNI